MTQYYGPSIEEIIKAGEILDRQPVPNRDKARIDMLRKVNGIIETHMPLDEMIEEASDENDKISQNPA